MNSIATAHREALLAHEKRNQYLRGIASVVPSRTIDSGKSRHAVLDAAFSQVAHPSSWKDAINVLMTFHEDAAGPGLGTYIEAIEYFTGTKPMVLIEKEELDQNGKQINTFRIISEGYSLGGAGG